MGTGGHLPSESGAVNKTEPIPWRGFRVIDTLITVVLALLAALALVLPFLDHALLRRLGRLAGAQSAVAWLANSNSGWIIGGALILLLLTFVLWKRHRIINDKRLWYSTGCPNCHERELVRVSRHFGDRFYGLVAIPAYRYACRNCTWRGLRVARREHSRETDAELEAALLRFDPESRSPVNGVAPAGDRPNPGSSVFHDAGDVDWTLPAAIALQVEDAPSPAAEADDDMEAAVESPNHTAAPDSPDEMEWIWRRPADEA